MPAGRPRKANPEDAATVIVALRVTREERALLDELVAAHARELASTGVSVTLTSYLRSLIRREAKKLRATPSPEEKASRIKGTGQS